MELKRKHFIEILAALRQLDGPKDKGTDYTFSGKVRLAIARRIRTLADSVEDLEVTRQKMLRQKGLVGADNAKKQAEVAEFNEEWTTLVNETEEIQLGRFLLSDLDLEKNKVPPSVVAALLPIITDDGTDLEPEA